MMQENRKSKSREIRLYNIIFPLWFYLYLVPWWGMLGMALANLAIDSAVFLIGCRHLKVRLPKKGTWKIITKIWVIGFFCDFLGALLFSVAAYLCTSLLDGAPSYWWTVWEDAFFNPFASIPAFVLVALIILLCGALIFVLNRKFAFTGLNLPRYEIDRLALYLAIFTAPWLFLVPSIPVFNLFL